MCILTEFRRKREKLFKGQIMRKMIIFEISSERKKEDSSYSISLIRSSRAANER